MIKRAEDLQQVEVHELRGGEGTLLKTLLGNSEETFGHAPLFATFTYPPGASIGYHTHDTNMEYYYILSGELTLEENGVVSAAVAVKMAKKIRKKLGATFGIGITGWAGPDGDDVGVVYVALACKGESFVRRVNAGKRSRGYIRQVSVTNAFDMLRRYLTGLDV